MKKIIIFWVICLGVFTHYSTRAQFTFSGEFRPRLEVNHGYQKLAGEDDQAAVVISQRTRLNFLYESTHFDAFASLQDVRVWGDEAHLLDVPSAALHEGWGKIKFTDYLAVKLGRQEIVYDDHRLFGNVGWTQQARSHDAAIVQFEKEGWKAHAGGAYNQEAFKLFNTEYPLSNYRVMWFIWLNKTFKEKLSASLVVVSDGNQADDIITENDTVDVDELVYRYTFGPHLQFRHKGLLLTGTFYYQAGQDVKYRDINALFASFSGFYTVKEKFTFGAAIDYLSGNDGLDPASGENKAFHTLWATNHKFYGFMDYFLNIPVHTKGGGLTDIYGHLKYKFNDKISAFSNIHYFMLSNNVPDPDNPLIAINKGLGTEIDIVFAYDIYPGVNISAGYSAMLPTESMVVLKGGKKDELHNWSWLMVTFKPVFFKSEKKD